ncbi:MAG: hypothetical protein HY332_02360 [Chloroflexi bacterium]|nr:hypothetical protein [Chloroflexota bacterium]
MLKTGRDEYGAWLPSAFRAFGEFKRPAYVYSTVPAIAIFGLTPFAIRLPAAIAGTLSVAALYVVAVLLFRNWRLALSAAGFLAISPWHLQFTRAAREVSLLVLGLVLLAAALLAAARLSRQSGGDSRRRHAIGACYVGAAAAFLLAVYAYPGGIVVAPLLVLVLFWAFRDRYVLPPRVWLCATAVALGLGLAPIAQQVLDGRARARPAQALLLADTEVLRIARERIARDRHDGVPWALNSPLLLSARRSIDAYLAHFDVTYLFTRGDAEWRHRSTDHGQLYLWDLPLLLLGIGQIVRYWRLPVMRTIAGWLLVGPLPAAVATEAPHAVRSIAMLPAWYLAAAAGVPPMWRWLRRRRLQRDWLLLVVLSVGFYLYSYHRHYPREHAESWSSGALEAFREARSQVEQGQFTKVVVPQNLEFAYVYALFATAYDPATYLHYGGSEQLLRQTNAGEPGPVSFPPFEARRVEWEHEPRSPGILYVVWNLEGRQRLPPDTYVVKDIQNTGGRSALRLVAFSGSS